MKQEYYVDLSCIIVEAENQAEAEKKVMDGFKDGTYKVEVCNVELVNA